MSEAYWLNRYEAYIAQWPRIVAVHRTLPAWHKRDCAYAMKWWVELGLAKEKNA